LFVREGYLQSQKHPEQLERHFKLALDAFRQANDGFGHKATQEEVALMLAHKELEATMVPIKFQGLSISETIAQVVASKQLARADKFKTDFNVPPKRFHWIVIRALAKAKHWDELRMFFSRGASPIGPVPFFLASFECGNKDEAMYYISRMRENPDRALCFARLEMWSEALEAAKAAKSEDLFIKLHGMCRNPQTKAALQQMMDALQ